ncbi:hypothetical protein EMCRGX_G016233 [Ephydatia muelleri]
MVLQSSFGVTSFVSEVVFLKIPSRQEKKREKRHAKYLEVRDDVLESAQKQSQKRNRPLNASGIKLSQKRNGPLNASGIKQSQKRNGLLNASGIKQSQKRNELLNASGIKKTQKRNGPLKGNVIGRVLNLLTWRREFGTGRLSVPCKTNEAIERGLPIKLFKGMCYSKVNGDQAVINGVLLAFGP